MNESPFVTTSRICSEQSNTFDLVRIIAKDTKGLPESDRDILRSAADELETAYRALISAHQQLSESQQRQIATNEQLIAARKAAPKPMTPIWTTIFSGPLVYKHLTYGK